MITNKLFRDCLAEIPEMTKAELEMSFNIARRISEILRQRGISQRDFAEMMGKRESEVSKWLTGRHNFTTNTIARIQFVLKEEIITIPAPRNPYHFEEHTPPRYVADTSNINE